MKIKEGFLLKKIADDYVVIPYEDNIVNFKAMIVLNETGAFLWEKLQNDITFEGLCESLSREFEVDDETAKTDAEEFVLILKDKGLIENE